MHFDDWTLENHQQRLMSQIAGALHICICILPREKEQGMPIKKLLALLFCDFLNN